MELLHRPWPFCDVREVVGAVGGWCRVVFGFYSLVGRRANDASSDVLVSLGTRAEAALKQNQYQVLVEEQRRACGAAPSVSPHLNLSSL